MMAADEAEPETKVAQASSTPTDTQPAVNLDQAIEQLAPSTRQLVADLFHGRFIGVRRVPQECFFSTSEQDDTNSDLQSVDP